MHDLIFSGSHRAFHDIDSRHSKGHTILFRGTQNTLPWLGSRPGLTFPLKLLGLRSLEAKSGTRADWSGSGEFRILLSCRLYY